MQQKNEREREREYFRLDKDRMTPCPRGGKLSESSEVESDDSSLMIVDKFMFPSVESFNSIDDHTSGTYLHYSAYVFF